MSHELPIEGVEEKRSAGPRHNYLRDWIYGGMDGTVTTIAVIAGVVGAHLSPVMIVIVGFANLAGVGFLRAANNFLGAKSEHDDLNHLASLERRRIELFPVGEREKVRQIFAAQGFAGADLERVVDLITSDRERWVRTVFTSEYGLPRNARSPWLGSTATFSAFVICGLATLTPFLLNVSSPLWVSLLLTGGLFFAIGSVKSRWSTLSWWRSGLLMTLVGGMSSGLSYAAGVLLKNMVN